MTTNPVREAHQRALLFTKGHRYIDAAKMVFELLERYSVEELNTWDQASLWWSFCEELADHLQVGHSSSLIPLYELARVSYLKDGSLATGSGEGLLARKNIARVEAIIKRIRSGMTGSG